MRASEGDARNAAGARVHYVAKGEGGPTLLAPAACWLADDLEPLAARRRVVFFDRSGRGASDPIDPATATFDNDVSDLGTVADTVGLERFDLLGWSYMGLVAAMYAAAAPDRVRRLILVGAVGTRGGIAREELEPELLAEQEAIRARRAARLDAAASRHLEEMRAAGLDRAEPERYCREEHRVNRPAQMGRPEALARSRADVCRYPNEWPANLDPLIDAVWASLGPRFDLSDRARTIAADALVVAGAADLIPLFTARRWAALIPRARLEVIDGVGHFPWLEAPGEFFPLVDGFLAG